MAIAPEADCIDEPSSFACPVDEPPLPENDDWLQQALPVLVLCCAIAAICALDRVVMSVAILPMTEQYGYTDVQKGQIASAFSLGYCLSQLPSGTLAALTSPKQVLVSPHPIPSPNPNPSPSPSPSPSPNPDPDPNPNPSPTPTPTSNPNPTPHQALSATKPSLLRACLQHGIDAATPPTASVMHVAVHELLSAVMHGPQP